MVIFLPLIDVFPVGSKGLGFTDFGFHDLCWAVLGTPTFLQVADYFALGPAPVYVVSPVFHVSFSSILYGYVYTDTHTHTHNFSRFLQHHPVRICVYTHAQSLFHSVL